MLPYFLDHTSHLFATSMKICSTIGVLMSPSSSWLFLNPFLQTPLVQDWSSPIKKKIKPVCISNPATNTPCPSLLVFFSLFSTWMAAKQRAGWDSRLLKKHKLGSGNQLTPNKEEQLLSRTEYLTDDEVSLALRIHFSASLWLYFVLSPF